MKPNILLITADHMRLDALACNAAAAPSWGLAHKIKTPNLDRLARSGVTFFNGFTPNPICVPARACITTGNYSHTCLGRVSNEGRIGADQPKLAEVFAGDGYGTYAIGKLHYEPYSPPGQPRLLHGFEHCELNEEGRAIKEFDPEGKLTGVEDYHDYLKAKGWGGYERAHGIGNNDVHPAASPVPAELHEEAWVADRAMAAMGRHRQQRAGAPFLLWASFAKPHSPYDPPRPWDAMYDPRSLPKPMGEWSEKCPSRDLELAGRRKRYGWDYFSPEGVQLARAYYAGMVSFQDYQIGRLLDYLDANALADNTIIVYSADHGDLLGDMGRFYKACLQDGSVKVPFIWRVPGLVAAEDSHQRTQLAGLQDILPTVASLAGVRLPSAVQGMDLTAQIRDASTPGREYYVTETQGPKYMVRTARWKYDYYVMGAGEELYDMTTPEGELRDLASEASCANLMGEMRHRLIEWARQTAAADVVQQGKLAVTPVQQAEAKFNDKIMGWRWY